MKPVKYILLLLFVSYCALWFIGGQIKIKDRFAHILFASEGEILAGQVSSDEQWRIQCEGPLPKKLATCIKLFEDQYFNYHPGINPISIIKAIKDNFKSQKVVRGGSTLTMQLARIIEGNRKRTYKQKIKEIILALALEAKYSKSEILQLYGQYAPFGGNTVGYCSAALRYYKKPIQQLSWNEAATLAVLPNAPSHAYPGKAQELLRKKRKFLLDKLLASDLLDDTTHRLALKEDIPTQSKILSSIGGVLLQTLKKEKPGQFQYHTTIDNKLQAQVNKLIREESEINAQENGIDNMAGIVISNDGHVLAYVGNGGCRTADCGSEVDILTSQRSPGSTLKPFLYAGALDAGFITSKSLLKDIPVFFDGFSPKNFDLDYRGVIPAHKALTQSLNIPAVNLLRQYNIEAFLWDLQMLDLKSISKSADHYGLSLILGGCEVTPFKLGQAYMNLARVAKNQKALELNKTIQDNFKVRNFPLSSGASYLTLKMMQGVTRPYTESGWEYYADRSDVSWKTGTSYGFRDAWSVGVTSDYTVVVWVGNADGEGKPGLTGVKKAAPIMFSIFDLLPSADPFTQPLDQLQVRTVCAASGYTPTSFCSETQLTYVPSKTNSIPLCKFHQQLNLDKSEQYRVYQNCAPEVVNTSRFVLGPIVNNYYKKFNGHGYSLPELHPNCVSMANDLTILYPTQGASILLPRDLGDQKKSLIAKAIPTTDTDSLFWFVDNRWVSTTQSDHEIVLDLKKGNHQLTVVSEKGSERTHYFKVVE